MRVARRDGHPEQRIYCEYSISIHDAFARNTTHGCGVCCTTIVVKQVARYDSVVFGTMGVHLRLGAVLGAVAFMHGSR